MSQTLLDKLSITGIRSFDNNRGETIVFFKPLTLIVGLNGSGKTTIIETLKYLTTGDLPPNSRGGAFIHDPQLAGEKEVLAVGLVAFYNTQGKKMHCSRRLQLTVKKNTRQMKTLEGQLQLRANGERTAISSRVAELDQMVPMYLGVSKAILDNVIFCHQDESLWPMSEPSVLKKKFDEIFEAMKYTKAIDNIKILRKKYNEDLGKLKIVESHAQDEKTKGEKVEKRMVQLSTGIEEMRTQVKALESQIDEAMAKNEEAADNAGEFNAKISELNGKRIEARTKEQSVQELKQHMKVLREPDEDLQSQLQSYEERVANFQQEMESKRQQYHQLAEEIKQSRANIDQAGTELGKVNAEKDAYERQLENREAAVRSAANDHGIRGFDQDLDVEKVKTFMDRIAKLAKEKRLAIERTQGESRKENQKVQQELNTLQERKSLLERDRQSAKSAQVENDKQMTKIRSQMREVDVDEGRQAVLQSNLDSIEGSYNDAKHNFEQTNWNQQVAEADRRVSAAEKTGEQLQAEMVQASKQSEEGARFNFVKGQLQARQKSLEANRGAYSTRIGGLVGDDWQPSGLRKVYDSAFSNRTSSLKQAESQRYSVCREEEQVRDKLKLARDDLKKKRKEVEELDKRIRQTIDSEDATQYPEVLEELEKELEAITIDRSNFAALQKYYLGVKKVLEEKNACQLCARPFKEEREKTAINKKLKQNLEQAQQALDEQNRADLEAEIASVKAVRPAYDRLKTLRNGEVFDTERAVSELEPQHQALTRKVEQHDEQVGQCQTALDDLESLKQIVDKIAKDAEDIAQFQAEIDTLSQKQSQASLNRTLEDVEAHIKENNDEQRAARAALNELQAKQHRTQNKMHSLETDLYAAKEKLRNVNQQIKDKAAFQEQLDEKQRANAELRERMVNTDTDIADLGPLITQTQTKFDDIQERGAQKEQKLQGELSELNTTLSKLEMAERDIRAYIENGGPAQLERSQRHLQNLKQELARLEDEQQQLTRSLNKLQEQGGKQEESKRQIVENLRFREHQRSLNALKEEIDELESLNAESDRQRWHEEATRWQQKRSKLTADQAGLIGEMKTMDTELQRLDTEWRTEYDGAAYRYREAHVKVEATKAAVEDLGRYGGALDKAIMRYHALKMDEINEIVDDLWRRTYQGTDVDTILIRSDSEGPTRAGNKSYNYRVCMIKQDAEMDMRGRCSAGQKVLASIIIRLALAECFGTNCGVLALDEPTTNLDRDNIRALAVSLNQIIKQRAAHQRNFQLIIITHDEEFLRDMRAQDFCDDYWRVARDQHQKSIIEKQSIHEVL